MDEGDLKETCSKNEAFRSPCGFLRCNPHMRSLETLKLLKLVVNCFKKAVNRRGCLSLSHCSGFKGKHEGHQPLSGGPTLRIDPGPTRRHPKT